MTDGIKVWTATLDKVWEITVFRTGPYRGRLVITNLSQPDKELFTKDVGLAYDALFGPDCDDVMTWQELAANYVDGLDNESKPDKASKNE
jgi:hypothetical protein